MGKFYNIDPETCSREELMAAIIDCKTVEENYYTLEQSCKRFINSQYGAMASKYYVCNNKNIAESITLQGQDLIKYSVIVVNRYFREDWNNDITAHNNIARELKEKHPNFDVDTFLAAAADHKINFGERDTLQIYGDTDSAYISLQPLIYACRVPLEVETDFVLAVNKYVLEGYLDGMFNKYAADFNCDKNIEKFELEKIARSVIMLAKKKYIMDISWKEPDVHVAPLHSLVYKGIEVIQGSTPVFARDSVKDFIKYMLSYIDDGKKPPYDEIIKRVISIKKQFIMQSPNDICKSFNIKDYEKYVANDKALGGPEYVEGIVVPMHIKAAAKYNNMLYNKAKRYRNKYNLIKSGDKVRFFYTNEKNDKKEYEVFGFIPNEFPIEFAPAMNMDEQFEKMILSPINRIVTASGYDEIPVTLAADNPLF